MIKDKEGAELFNIQRGASPIWCLKFCPQKFDSSDNMLMTGSWDGKLVNYQL
jgi:hypothetical protein